MSSVVLLPGLEHGEYGQKKAPNLKLMHCQLEGTRVYAIHAMR